ncbi:MAG: hypothetical protein ABIN20_05825, partial [candidate division WOR-3 bacterium]
KHKPSSDVIGRYASLVTAAILGEICTRTRNGWQVRVLPASRGDIDLLLISNDHLVLCEIKASPLIALPLCKRLKQPLTSEVDGGQRVVETHQKTDCPDFQEGDLCLYLPSKDIPIQIGGGSPISNFIKEIKTFLKVKLEVLISKHEMYCSAHVAPENSGSSRIDWKN